MLKKIDQEREGEMNEEPLLPYTYCILKVYVDFNV